MWNYQRGSTLKWFQISTLGGYTNNTGEFVRLLSWGIVLAADSGNVTIKDASGNSVGLTGFNKTNTTGVTHSVNQGVDQKMILPPGFTIATNGGIQSLAVQGSLMDVLSF